MTAHKHAALMAQYAEDALETETPWERWQCKDTGHEWGDLTQAPAWYKNVDYRRKPKTIRIGNMDVPEPERKALPLNAKYYVPSLYSIDLCSMWTWDDDHRDAVALKRGLVHLTKEAAAAHAKALIALTGSTE